MDKISNTDLGRPDLHQLKNSQRLPLQLMLDNVRSALNIGSVFRTADAFLVGKIHLCGITAVPPHREIQKTALGSTESVPWVYCPSTVDAVKSLREKGVKVFAAEQVKGSIPLQDFIPPAENFVIIFGHEMDGVSQEVVNLCDGAIEIPQEGIKHSLNISVSAGIICWEIWKKYKQGIHG